jgi:hypothetical protein
MKIYVYKAGYSIHYESNFLRVLALVSDTLALEAILA